MKKVAIVFWSGTGNTEAMAELIAQGVTAQGHIATIIPASVFKADYLNAFDAFALGCPATGDEALEPAEFLPLYEKIEPMLLGRRVALFGSYGWNDGSWMELWKQRVSDAGANVIGTAIAMGYPETDAASTCILLGRELVD
ncbi:MAG: flavodoxin [Eggerthellaceae bacterium]|nr:flavodoxin [Eggerthellaceae bacterium]